MVEYKIERDKDCVIVDPETGIEEEQAVWLISDGITEWFVPVAQAETKYAAWAWFADHKIY